MVKLLNQFKADALNILNKKESWDRKMKDFVLEACVDSVESALAAVKGGANQAGALQQPGHWGNHTQPVAL